MLHPPVGIKCLHAEKATVVPRRCAQSLFDRRMLSLPLLLHQVSRVKMSMNCCLARDPVSNPAERADPRARLAPILSASLKGQMVPLPTETATCLLISRQVGLLVPTCMILPTMTTLIRRRVHHPPLVEVVEVDTTRGATEGHHIVVTRRAGAETRPRPERLNLKP